MDNQSDAEPTMISSGPANSSHRISRNLSRADWAERKSETPHDSDPSAQIWWGKTFDDYFRDRINSRYLEPINQINDRDGSDTPDKNCGEGFAIVALLCSLVEFLETTRTGSIFAKGSPRDYPPPAANVFKYGTGASEAIFVKFLNDHMGLSVDDAPKFFSHVRCAILHNAQTDGNWRIRVNESCAPTTEMVIDRDGEKLLYRDVFLQRIQSYLVTYREELLACPALQEAFIRKIDSL